MALSAEQRLYVFEILDIPPNGVGVELWGTLGYANAVQSNSFGTPTGSIDDLIALLSPEQETIIAGLIEEWLLVRTSEIHLEKAEDVEGVVSSAGSKRELIRRQLLVHIPLYRDGELVERHGRGPHNLLMRG